MIYFKALGSPIGGCKGLYEESTLFIFIFLHVTLVGVGILVQSANTLTTAYIYIYTSPVSAVLGWNTVLV